MLINLQIAIVKSLLIDAKAIASYKLLSYICIIKFNQINELIYNSIQITCLNIKFLLVL